MARQIRRLLGMATALVLLPAWASAQDGAVISGVVRSDAGAPLALASVFIEGMGIGTTTRETGEYTLPVPSARVQGQTATLSVRLIGYRPQTAPITLRPGTITQNFTLAPNPLRLGEVIITGAGTVSTREKLGNTVNSVSAEQIQRSGEQNIVAALAGKAPNIQITTQSGDPGASSFIRIRGAKTILGTGQPLFVVDGTPIDNSTTNTRANDPFGGFTGSTVAPNRGADINPDDIASVEILKGAAAAAIYGARAGQGVVLITTKRGLPGATKYSLRSSFTLDQPTTDYPLQRKYGMGQNGAAPGAYTCCNPIGSAAAASYGPVITGQRFDHFDELFETGHQMDHTLSASGGNDRTLFYFSGGAYNNQGTIVGSKDEYQRYSVRVNASHRIMDELRIGANVSYVDVRGSFVQKGSNTSGLLLAGLRSPPDFNNVPYLDPVTGLHRSFRVPTPTLASLVTGRGYDNPFFVINEFENTGTTNRTFGNVIAEWNPLPWLTITETLGADFAQEDQLQGYPKTASTFPSGQVYRYAFNNTLIDQQLVGAATYDLNENVAGTLTLGHSLGAERFQQVWIQGNSLIADQPFKLSNTLSQLPPVDSVIRTHTDGIFGQATVDLYDQLYLTAGFRYDGSSTFSDESRRNWFPKASVAWTFTNWLPGIARGDRNIISFGKLRAAYGEVGQQPGAYQLLAGLVAGGSFLDGGWGSEITANQGGVPALFSSDVKAQAKIKPERTKEVEAGIDLGLLNDRADLGVTWYEANSEDVIFGLPLPPSTGYEFQVQNAARIRNKGWEVMLNVRPLRNPDMDWELGFQWGTNDNKLLSLAEGVQFTGQNGGFAGNAGTAWVGGRVATQRGLDFLRCGAPDPAPASGTTIAQLDAACASAPRGALYIAANGFPVVDGTLRQIVDPQPTWTGAMSNSFRWRQFRLTALMDHQQGGEVWNGTKGALYFFGTHKDTEGAREGTKVFGTSWMPGEAVVGPGAGQAVLLVNPATSFNWFGVNGGGFGSVPRQFVEDATFTKLREISLAYSFVQPWVARRLGLTSLDVRLTGRNLAIWTDYTGFDPEGSLTGGEVPVQGVDFFNHPLTRSYLFSVTLNR